MKGNASKVVYDLKTKGLIPPLEQFGIYDEESFDDLLKAQNREEKDEREVLTAGDLYNYMEYLKDHGCIEIWDDREEWEK